MVSLAQVIAELERIAPPALAEEWDNVGLLVGDRARQVARVMTCLTITPDSAREAIDGRADLIVAHHPLPFRPLRRVTSDTTAGRLLLELIRAGIAVYSAHTAYDSAALGINQRLAEALGLTGIAPLRVSAQTASAGQPPESTSVGTGRHGYLPAPESLRAIASRLCRLWRTDGLQLVGDPERQVEHIGVACGAADDLLELALGHGCEALVMGEARFHTCLEAQARGLALLLPGHFATERFAMERLAGVLEESLPKLHVWCSERERDPLTWTAGS